MWKRQEDSILKQTMNGYVDIVTEIYNWAIYKIELFSDEATKTLHPQVTTVGICSDAGPESEVPTDTATTRSGNTLNIKLFNIKAVFMSVPMHRVFWKYWLKLTQVLLLLNNAIHQTMYGTSFLFFCLNVFRRIFSSCIGLRHQMEVFLSELYTLKQFKIKYHFHV